MITALLLVTAPASPAGAGVARALTVTGTVTFWDDYRCVPEFEADPPASCFDASGTRIRGEPVGLWAPAAPRCGEGPLCAVPDEVVNWVFSQHPDRDACLAATAAKVSSRCEVAAVGNLDVAALVADGPWCGWGGSDHAQGEPLRVSIDGEVFTFQFLFPLTTNHLGPVFAWELREWSGTGQVGARVGAMTVTVTSPTDGSCGLAPPEFAASHGYEVTVDLAWVER